MSIILASGSPRRKELMEMLGVKDLKIIPAKGDECPPAGASPQDTVLALSGAKAGEVAKICGEEDIVIAADTIVWFDGRIFGKPHSREDAADMLRRLSGNTHQVYTGITLVKGSRRLENFDVTDVRFRSIPDEEIAAYVDTGEPMDKAGAYGAQGKGSVFVEGINGDFFNVMGLPLCLLDSMLKEFGISLIG